MFLWTRPQTGAHYPVFFFLVGLFSASSQDKTSLKTGPLFFFLPNASVFVPGTKFSRHQTPLIFFTRRPRDDTGVGAYTCNQWARGCFLDFKNSIQKSKKHARGGHLHSGFSGCVRLSAELLLTAAAAAVSRAVDAAVRSAAVSERWCERATVIFRTADRLIW